MANINIENISDLDLNGHDLFEDSESFMTELSDDSEQADIIGGAVYQSPGVVCAQQGSCLQTDVAIPPEGPIVVYRQ